MNFLGSSPTNSICRTCGECQSSRARSLYSGLIYRLRVIRTGYASWSRSRLSSGVRNWYPMVSAWVLGKRGPERVASGKLTLDSTYMMAVLAEIFTANDSGELTIWVAGGPWPSSYCSGASSSLLQLSPFWRGWSLHIGREREKEGWRGEGIYGRVDKDAYITIDEYTLEKEWQRDSCQFILLLVHMQHMIIWIEMCAFLREDIFCIPSPSTTSHRHSQFWHCYYYQSRN